MLALDGLVLLAVCLFVVALLGFLMLCRLSHVALVAKALRACCDSLLVLWPVVNWPVLALLLPLACLRMLSVEVVVCWSVLPSMVLVLSRSASPLLLMVLVLSRSASPLLLVVFSVDGRPSMVVAMLVMLVVASLNVL